MNYRNAAKKAVNKAASHPMTWSGDGQHDDEVCFANGVYSVGSNGDVADYDDAAAAAEALGYQWEMQDEEAEA